MTIYSKKSVKYFTSLAIALSLGGAAVIAPAQTVSDNSVPTTRLDIPEDLRIFGENDPNVRRATAVVNGEIITGTDIDHRLALLVASSGGGVSEEEQKRLRVKVLGDMIDETLKIQAASANDISVSTTEVDATFEDLARSNFRITVDELNRYLQANGTSADSLKRQIKGELAWQQVIRRNVTPFINVSEEEAKSIIDRLESSKGVEEYRIAEIFLSANASNANEIFQNGRRIMEQIQQGGNFGTYAQQWSEATTASVGGDLGFVKLDVLPAELANAAQSLSVGQLAGPIEIPGGFSIVYLVDKRRILSADPRDSKLSLKQLAVLFPANISEAEATNRASQFASAAKTIRGCGDANRVAAEVGATIVDNDNVAVRDLPTALQNPMLEMSIGEATQPFGSINDGVRVLVLCGRDEVKEASGPSMEQIMGDLEDERVKKRAQIYLRDLRRDAIIEYN